jgi:hypothetical protein
MKTKNTKKIAEKKLDIFKFEEIGDTISGKLEKVLEGEYGPVFMIAGKLVNINKIALARLVKRAIADKKLEIGSKVSIEYCDRNKRTKIFKMIVDGEEIVGQRPLTESSFEDVVKMIDNQIDSYKKN